MHLFVYLKVLLSVIFFLRLGVMGLLRARLVIVALPVIFMYLFCTTCYLYVSVLFPNEPDFCFSTYVFHQSVC